MFILEEPYVSDLLLETLEKNQFEVLNNEIIKTDKKLNLINASTAINFYKNNTDLKIYSNSENSISWVLNNFSSSNLAKSINIFKDKYKFRELLKPLYPNFYFREISLSELDNLDINTIPKPFIIKPTVGFLSLGVHKVNSNQEWIETIQKLKSEVETFSKLFPSKVVNSSKFIIEEIITGTEYAVDAYYNNNGEAVILNIFKHPFVSKEDVSDRAYISSKSIIQENLTQFTEILNKIGSISKLKNFPMHIELIKNEKDIVPVEINPMRFAGWCTTDLAYYAYGINIYEYFVNQTKPDWNNIFKSKKDEIYYFAMAETPQKIDKTLIDNFDYDLLAQNFSKILEFRKIDYLKKPMFAIIFGEAKTTEEINKILKLNMEDFIQYSAKI